MDKNAGRARPLTVKEELKRAIKEYFEYVLSKPRKIDFIISEEGMDELALVIFIKLCNWAIQNDKISELLKLLSLEEK